MISESKTQESETWEEQDSYIMTIKYQLRNIDKNKLGQPASKLEKPQV